MSARLAYSVPEIAELLGVSVATVWRLIKAGTLKVIRLRGSTRITAESLAELMKGGAA